MQRRRNNRQFASRDEEIWPSDSEFKDVTDDRRTRFQRERDRILYSDAFERLRGVTQVVSPIEGLLCHDRHTHSLRVEQLATRIAQRVGSGLQWPHGAPNEQPIPDVCAAAALAHDLGHPPFGHVAEHELDQLLRNSFIRDPDGYEGNAQSFRIITRLAVHKEAIPGMRLSRRVLLATLKYPWLRNDKGRRSHKFGAYRDDNKAFEFAVLYTGRGVKTIEAAIMDIADSITYSVHDLIDFYRAGLINLGLIGRNPEKTVDDFKETTPRITSEITDALMDKISLLENWPDYEDDEESRARVQNHVSLWITKYVNSLSLKWTRRLGWGCELDEENDTCMRFDQWLVQKLVIDGERLAVTQLGHKRIVRGLFREFFRSACQGEPRPFPAFFRRQVGELKTQLDSNLGVRRRLLSLELSAGRGARLDAREQRFARLAGRLAADVVASLTDARASALYARIIGSRPIDGFLIA